MQDWLKLPTTSNLKPVLRYPADPALRTACAEFCRTASVNLGFCRIRFWYFQGDQSHLLLESHNDCLRGAGQQQTRGYYLLRYDDAAALVRAGGLIGGQ